MKKTAKKLMLAKETVRDLTAPRLGRVVGGRFPSAWLGCTNDTTETSATCYGVTEPCVTAPCEVTMLCQSNQWECPL